MYCTLYSIMHYMLVIGKKYWNNTCFCISNSDKYHLNSFARTYLSGIARVLSLYIKKKGWKPLIYTSFYLIQKERKMDDWRKRHKECEVHPPCLVLGNQGLLLYAECPSEMQGDSWGPGQHTGPLNEKKWPAFTSSFKNSFTSCQIPLWPGTCTGQDWACMLAKPLSAWPGSPVQWTADSPVSRFSGFSPPSFSPSISLTTFGMLLAEQVIIRVPGTPLLLFYKITVQCAHLKASAERIRAAKCWALNKLSAGGLALKERRKGRVRKWKASGVQLLKLKIL